MSVIEISEGTPVGTPNGIFEGILEGIPEINWGGIPGNPGINLLKNTDGNHWNNPGMKGIPGGIYGRSLDENHTKWSQEVLRDID